jgi:hypothetical protein
MLARRSSSLARSGKEDCAPHGLLPDDAASGDEMPATIGANGSNRDEHGGSGRLQWFCNSQYMLEPGAGNVDARRMP